MRRKKKEPLKSSWILEQVKENNVLRSREREFHGIEREFIYHHERIIKEYQESKDIKHPRDIGTAREAIIKNFLKNSGYLPSKYGVSEISARVASPSGHISNEIDILIYDKDNFISLMNRQGVYEVYPVESVYGVIQVKSKLTKDEIKSGLENIASFKKLSNPAAKNKSGLFIGEQSRAGFGLLVAYDSDMEWVDIVREVESFANNAPSNKLLCNAVFILNKGTIFHGEERFIAHTNTKLEEINKLVMHGRPDHYNLCLYDFYSILLELVRGTVTCPPIIEKYFRLPSVAGNYSYNFSRAHFAEIMSCDKHGNYQKKISENNIEKIIEVAKKAEPINWIKATDIAYGKAGDNFDAYAKQPTEVKIYNPESLPLSEILLIDSTIGDKQVKAMGFDEIECQGMIIWLPYYYLIKEEILEKCQKCKQAEKRTQKP